MKANVVKRSLILFRVVMAGSMAIATISCTPIGAGEFESGERGPEYTSEEIAAFKKEFDRISSLPIPESGTLVEFGIDICNYIEISGGDVQKAKSDFKSTAVDREDWKVIDEVGMAATVTLCSEYKGGWVGD